MNKPISYFIFLSLLLFSCIENKSYEKILPSNVNLTNNNLYSVFFIKEINNDPIKQFPAWNDSLLKLCQINEINIKTFGINESENASESFRYNFNVFGILKSYLHTKSEISPSFKSEIIYDKNKALIKTFLNESLNEDLVMLNRNTGVVYVRYKKNKSNDSLEIIGSINKPKIIVKRSNDYILSTNFILKQDQALVSIYDIIEKNKLNKDAILASELKVTYVNNEYLPIESYTLNEQLIQGDLVEKWDYDNHKKLINYSEYIHSNIIKEYKFQYNQEKLMSSFTYNRINYEFEYK